MSKVVSHTKLVAVVINAMRHESTTRRCDVNSMAAFLGTDVQETEAYLLGRKTFPLDTFASLCTHYFNHNYVRVLELVTMLEQVIYHKGGQIVYGRIVELLSESEQEFELFLHGKMDLPSFIPAHTFTGLFSTQFLNVKFIQEFLEMFEG